MNSKIKFNIKSISNILDVWVPMKIQYGNVPGLNICIAHKGNPIYSKSFGYSDLDKKIRIDENAIFRIASHSKMFTAVGIMQLQEQGKLKIDDSVNYYLPWFKGKNKISNNKNITIRQLLSHQSGIFRDGNTHHWDNHNFPKNIQTTISEDSIIFENGSTFKYSNHAYATLGAIIEKISGEKYGDFMNKNIIAPLNLKHTYSDLPDDIPSALSNGYGRVFPGENKREVFKHSKTYAYASATGFMSTTKDIAIFLSSLNLESSKSVLNRESKKAMIKSHGCTDRKNGNIGYGLGLDIEPIKNKLLIGHGGGYPGFITKSKNSVSDDIQVIVFTNTNSNLSTELSDTIFDFLYNSNNEIFEGKELTKNYNGIYRGRWGDMVIANIGSKLVSFPADTHNPRSEWSVFKNIDEDTFKNTDKLGYGLPGENIKFDKSSNQLINRLTMPSGILEKIM